MYWEFINIEQATYPMLMRYTHTHK